MPYRDVGRTICMPRSAAVETWLRGQQRGRIVASGKEALVQCGESAYLRPRHAAPLIRARRQDEAAHPCCGRGHPIDFGAITDVDTGGPIDPQPLGGYQES